MRRKRNLKRSIEVDPKYGDEVVAKFVNSLMKDGKKSTARKSLYEAFDEIKEKEKTDPLAIFHTAISNVAPAVEVKSRRVGGANYQIPCEVRGDRRNTLAMRWMISAARSTKGKDMSKCLSDEILLAFKKEGSAMKKRENTHRMAEANKAFAHFAW